LSRPRKAIVPNQAATKIQDRLFDCSCSSYITFNPLQKPSSKDWSVQIRPHQHHCVPVDQQNVLPEDCYAMEQ
jgi:hypothetical protein